MAPSASSWTCNAAWRLQVELILHGLPDVGIRQLDSQPPADLLGLLAPELAVPCINVVNHHLGRDGGPLVDGAGVLIQLDD
jgi:hypothetical protein